MHLFDETTRTRTLCGELFKVGPLLKKLDEISARSSSREGPKTTSVSSRTRVPLAKAVSGSNSSSTTLNVAGDSTDIDSAEEFASSTASSGRRGGGGGGTGRSSGPLLSPTMSSSSSSFSSSARSARLVSMGYGDVRGPRWVRQAVAEMMGARMFHREDVDPDNLVIAAGATSVLR